MKRFRFGPGLLVTAAFIGPGTIVTASRAGAGYGVTLLWAVLFSVVATVILQDMAARVGLAGRRGLAEAIRDSLDNRWIRVGALGLITVTILVGNAAFQTGNLIGASLGLSLLSGLPQEALALVVGGLVGGLLLTGTYQTIQNALVCLVGLMSLVFCAVAGLTAADISDLIAGVLIPRLPPGSLLTVLALIGTTFVSYNLFLHASTALERWPDASRNDENIRESRRDTVFSVVLGGLITAAVVVAASPLLGQGADAANAAAVAERLAPLLGRAAPVFFGLGLFAAGLTSAITAPLAAAYAARGARVAAGPSERLIPSALGIRARHRRVLRRRAGWLAVLRHPAGAGGERSRTPTHADLAAHGRQQDEDHGDTPQLTSYECTGRDRRAGDLVAGAAATSPGAGACRIGMGEERSVVVARYASSDIQARWFAPRERARWGGGDGPMVDGLSPIAPFEALDSLRVDGRGQSAHTRGASYSSASNRK